MRFQLLSILAVLASASATEAAPQSERGIAARAGPAGVPRPLGERAHSLPRRTRSRHGKRKTCRVRPATPSNGEGVLAVKPSATTTDAAEASEGSAAPSDSAAAPSDSAAPADPTAAEDKYEEDSVKAAKNPGSVDGTEAAINTSTQEKAGDVDKWTGTVAPDQNSLGVAIDAFSTSGDSIGNNLIDVGSSVVKHARFEDMTIEGNNPGLKDAYGRLRVNGDQSVTFTYRQGQVNDNDSWFWYTTADPGNTGMDLTAARTASFTYTIKFQEGFDWKLGGKLPGWYGGDSADAGKHCTGHAASPNCFSSRLMWRPDGVGELYNYYWGSKQAYCTDPSTYRIGTAQIVCHSGSGDSLGRGAFHFEAGKAITVTNTITLNTMNGDKPNEDGKQSLIVDGVKVIEANNLVLRHHDAGRIRGLFFSTFFGGSGSSWASPKEQDVTFSDISVSVLEKF